ncbi:hypothetical protein DL764_006667 [Monosporascus ibericus]|uniref:Uncharacterized protein n=1 Tax=Monosporascus ibericus TaxID=155417 RepID=A0A4Q4T4H5_9PEZI|nr:hypothetical protein DL764_006667 [Monosporascus ibericus]
MDDPWDWDVDRVVQEFCTPTRSWRSHKVPPQLPPSDQLEASLREHEVDGYILLTYTDTTDLYRDLGIKKLSWKKEFGNAIEQLRRRSPQYQCHLREHEKGPENGDIPDPQPQLGESTGDLGKKRLLEELASFESLGDSERRTERMGPSPPPKNFCLLPSPAPAPAIPSAPEPLRPEPHSTGEPAQKKRRIAPTIITTDVDVNAIRNIPTAADEISGVSPDHSVLPIPAVDPSEAYLGMDAVTRIDIADLDSPVADNPLTQEDKSLSLFHSSHLPRGRCLQMHRLYKRLLLPRRSPARLIPTKPDTVFGANDPNRDEVLPLYGESDGEYDSETWEEMEAEIGEQGAVGTGATGLETDQVNSIIDEEIQRFVDKWNEHRLPKLVRNAYKVWNQPRRRGYLRLAMDNERRLVHALEARITKYREEILEQQFFKEADVRLMSRIMEQTVDEKQTASWKVSIMSSENEPPKPAPLPRSSVRKPRKPKPVGDDGSEILTSESDGNDLNGFIFDDGIPLSDDVSPPPGSPMDLSVHDSPQKGNGTANGVKDHPMDQHVLEDASELAQSDKALVPGVPSNPRTPLKARQTQVPVIDLTITPELSLGPGPHDRSAAIRERRIRTKVPKAETASSQSSSKGQKYKYASSLIMSIDDLSQVEQIVAQQLRSLGPNFLSYIFTLASEMKPEEIWKDFILPALEVPMFPQVPYTEEEMDIVVAFRILRLFDVWLGKEIRGFGHYKRLDVAEKRKIMEDGKITQEEFSRFVNFLDRVGARFDGWSKVKLRKRDEQSDNLQSTTAVDQAASETNPDFDDFNMAEDDIDGEVADGSPSKKRRPKIIRNREAQNLREIERVLAQEQEARKKQLRANLERLEASGVVMGSQRAMIINESKEENQGFIYVHDEIAPRIKEHQVAGIRFMWDQVVSKSGTRQGCLLAHTMGLGKTMQIITLLVAISQASASEDESIRSQIPDELRESKTLIICPPGLVNNWLDEMLFWAPEDHNLGQFFKIDTAIPIPERPKLVQRWAQDGGVLVLGYQLLKSLMNDERLQDLLLQAPNLVVADEAHYMKNPASKTHIATANFETQSRIALTGSPLANNVEEYHSMINWVAPNYLSDLREFRQDYAHPIRDGLSVDSTAYQKRKAMSRLHALKTTVGPKVHRLTIATLKNDIPPKTEFVLTVPLTQIQKQAYESYVESSQRRFADADNATTKIFASLNTLGLLCTHPNCFLKFLEQKGTTKKGKPKSDEESSVSLPAHLVSDQISLLRKTKDIDRLFHSWKIPMVTAILDECRRVGDGVLVFSQSIPALDYLENILRMQKRTVQRLDGSTAIGSRQNMVKEFNRNGTEVFLISTTAGGVGLNITGANRVIIFDFKFNPQHEQQAVGRAYRIGQTKPVFVYRFVSGGTFEETLLSRSIFKMQLADRVVDKKNPIPKASHFGELFKMPFEPEQKDLSQHRGRDTVIDCLLDSELRAGLRSIILMDTFQEESLEDSKLSADERQEAAMLVAQQEARRAGKPWHPAPVIEEHGVGLGYSQQIAHDSGIVSGPTPATVAAPSDGRASPGNAATPPQNAAATPTLQAQATTVRPERPSLGQHLQPTMGASTGIRNADKIPGRGEASQATNLSANVFNAELKRLFEIDAIVPNVQEKRRQLAQAIVTSFEEQENQRPSDEQRKAKWAVVEAANSPRFVEAVDRGLLTPQRLATMDAASVEARRQQFDAMSGEDWTIFIAEDTRNGDPEHLQDALRKMASTPERDSESSRKSHRMDDVLALQAVMERRQSNKPSAANGSSPRLPGWAKKAVASQGKQGRIAPPSEPVQPPTNSTTPRPLPRSPFT